MKLKTLICFVIALLLAVLAVPAFAEPVVESITDPNAVTEVTAEGETFLPKEPRLPGEEEDIGDEEPVLYATPETTIGIVPIYEDIVPINEELPAQDAGIFSQRNLTFGALGLGALALLLSIVALARTRRKSAPNATGNYQKYF